MSKFDEEMKLRRLWEQEALEHFNLNSEEKLSYVEVLIRKAIILEHLLFGTDKKKAYEIYIKFNLDELESHISLMKTVLNMRYSCK